MRHRCAPMLALVVLVAFPSAGARAQTQAEMDATARRDYQRADARLSAVYGQVRAMLDAVGRLKLTKAERAWTAYRDAQADLESDVNRGGSMAPLTYFSAQTALTNARIQALQSFQADLKDR